MRLIDLIRSGGDGLARVMAISAVLMLAYPALSDVPTGYVLGPGDSLTISVAQQPDLDTKAQVGADNTVTFPMIGTVQIGKLTVQSAQSLIAKKLRDGHYLNDPIVTIFVQQFRSGAVSALGWVSHPGQISLDRNYRIAEIISQAGGVQGEAGSTVVLIRQLPDGSVMRKEMAIEDAFSFQNSVALEPVQSGDVIFVPKAPQFFVYGEVKQPGSFRLEPGTTMEKAIAMAGGLNDRGSRRNLKLRRESSVCISQQKSAAGWWGTTATCDVRKKVKLEEAVQPGDVLYVGERLF